MRVRSGMILALSASLALAGCAAGAAGGGGPLTSPTGKTYPPGTPPEDSEFTAAATLELAQGRFDEALAQARLGIAADSTNPQHFYLAGEAAAGQGNYELADSMWNAAEEIFPAYELEIEPARESAWADAFNAGVEAYNAGDTDTAIEAWQNADMIYMYRPQAIQNLAVTLAQDGRYDEAIAAYRKGLADLEELPASRVLEEAELAERDESKNFMLQNLAQLLVFTEQYAEAETILREQLALDPDNMDLKANLASALTQLGRNDEASAIYDELLSDPNMTTAELFNIGVSLFQAGEHLRAADAFQQVIDAQPRNRDAWYNRANALYAAEEWDELIAMSDGLIAIDPLDQNSALILARAYRDLERNEEALAQLQRVEELPIFLESMQLQPSQTSTSLRGEAIGNAAAEGTPIQLRFTFYDDTGELGSSSVTISAPAAEQHAQFEVSFAQPATAYSYELVQ